MKIVVFTGAGVSKESGIEYIKEPATVGVKKFVEELHELVGQ